MADNKVNRRDFLKTGSFGALAATLGVKSVPTPPGSISNRSSAAVVEAIGDTLIPSEPGDPGYKTLETYNITAEVIKELTITEDQLSSFDTHAKDIVSGQTFLQCSEPERARYFDAVFSGAGFSQPTALELRETLLRVREAVFRVYYKNYPEHKFARDNNNVPILPKDDLHQITNPNTTRLPTGWDAAGFMGPLTWAEEERRRAIVKKIDWNE